jgi:hypothetical protein
LITFYFSRHPDVREIEVRSNSNHTTDLIASSPYIHSLDTQVGQLCGLAAALSTDYRSSRNISTHFRPHKLKISSGAETVEITDILIGEVWVGVGQSNMIMGLGNSDGGEQASSRFKDYPNLRFVATHAQSSETPAADFKNISWVAPTSGVSAVSFFFAEALYNHLGGSVPVGIINLTLIAPAEAWADAERLKAVPALEKLAGHKIFPHLSGQVFNGAIKPLAPYAIRGALYYQGEMNAGRGPQFRLILPKVKRSSRSMATGKTTPRTSLESSPSWTRVTRFVPAGEKIVRTMRSSETSPASSPTSSSRSSPVWNFTTLAVR